MGYQKNQLDFSNNAYIFNVESDIEKVYYGPFERDR